MEFQRRLLEIRIPIGRFRPVGFVSIFDPARVHRATDPAERPRILRHVLRNLYAGVGHLPNGHPMVAIHTR